MLYEENHTTTSLLYTFSFVYLYALLGFEKLITPLMISSAFPDLLPLAQLMTGRHDSTYDSQRWTNSEKVDIIVVDISRRSPCFNLHRFEVLRGLDEICLADIEPDVVLRLFLVEDMTAVVVETLGSAFSIPPRLFNCHMKYQGHVKSGWACMPFPETQQPLSRFRDPEFFSLPFQRLFEEPGVIKSDRRQRFTLYRDHNTNTSILEERVSGIVCNHHSSSSRMGMLPCFVLLQFSQYGNRSC